MLKVSVEVTFSLDSGARLTDAGEKTERGIRYSVVSPVIARFPGLL